MAVIDDVMGELDEDGLSALVACAVAVGSADDRFDRAESRMMVDVLEALGFERDDIDQALSDVLDAVGELSPTEMADWAAENVDDDALAEACVVLAAAVAARTGGIGAKEGVVIQHIANAVGVGYPGNRYMQLLGEGMQLGRA